MVPSPKKTPGSLRCRALNHRATAAMEEDSMRELQTIVAAERGADLALANT
jgi:hypothetical protein